MKKLLLFALALTALVAPQSAAAAPFYEGYVSEGAGKVRSGSQGGLWQAVFRERAMGRVRYRVCLIHEQFGTVRRVTNRSRWPDATTCVGWSDTPASVRRGLVSQPRLFCESSLSSHACQRGRTKRGPENERARPKVGPRRSGQCNVGKATTYSRSALVTQVTSSRLYTGKLGM
jgi:hypothetical protein